MIYYYYFEENEKTFLTFEEAKKTSVEDGVMKFRDTLGGEYFN